MLELNYMDKQKASHLIKANHLITGKISKNILRSIVENKALENDAKNIISDKEFNYLKNIYQNYIEKINEINLRKKPKYLPFYLYLKEKYPSLTWEIKSEINNKPIVNLCAPRVNNLRVSLLSLLLEKINPATDFALNRKYSCLNNFPLNVIAELSFFMESVTAIYPNDQAMLLICQWLISCINQQKATIFIPICPDYSTEPTGDKNCPYRHTFTELGTGLGPVAQRFLAILPTLKIFLEKLNIKPEIIAGIADFEAFCPDSPKRFNLTENQFLEKVLASKNLFHDKTNIKTHMISELIGGKAVWLELQRNIEIEFNKNNFGKSNITVNSLVEIVKKRRALYERWFGVKSNLEDYLPIVLEQGATYSVMGDVFSQKFENCLILGADTEVFVPFYSFVKPIPVLYLEKNYC